MDEEEFQQSLELLIKNPKKRKATEKKAGKEDAGHDVDASGKKKMKKIHFSPEMCKKKSNVHKFLQDHCNRGANSWETSALTSAHMVLCLESEKNTF